MNYDQSIPTLPAPCIVDTGIIVNKEDMLRLLDDLEQVHYIYTLDGDLQSKGEGWLLEVFADNCQATIVTNQSLYINVSSFDYLRISREETQAIIDLVQENRQLRLLPISSPNQILSQGNSLEMTNLEAMVTQVLSAKWDVQLDDEDDLFCP